jgi:4-amino-4-deoxy-L-arabinose transferase-like glycosyltransferase
MMNRAGAWHFIPILVLVGLSYFIIFQNLGKFQIRMWDEATYANNAIDMLLNQNPLVVEHLGQPDLYNTKPPLAIWLQALSMKLFGINEWAVRLPSGLAGLFTILLVYFFGVRVLKSKTIGFVAATILLTTKGFISNHMVRTGDLDAILLFWLTLGIFTFIELVVKKPEQTRWHFLLLSISLTGGFLTKGIAGFFFLPCMFIISVLFRNYWLYQEKWLYWSAAATLLLCASYYGIRESLTPGYLQIVLESEIFRFNEAIMSWHVHPFDYYFQNLKNARFHPYLYILPIIIFSFFVLKTQQFQAFLYLLLTAVGYFLLISYPEVKLEWYDAPLFPLLSLLIGLSFIESGLFIFRKQPLQRHFRMAKPLLLVTALLFIIKPLKEVLEIVKYPEEQIYYMDFDGAYLKHLKQNRPDIKKLTVFKQEDHPEHYDQVLFYLRAYNLQHGYDIHLSHKPNFETAEVVMVCKQNLKDQIESHYLAETLHTWRDGSLLLIKAVR